MSDSPLSFSTVFSAFPITPYGVDIRIYEYIGHSFHFLQRDSSFLYMRQRSDRCDLSRSPRETFWNPLEVIKRIKAAGQIAATRYENDTCILLVHSFHKTGRPPPEPRSNFIWDMQLRQTAGSF